MKPTTDARDSVACEVLANAPAPFNCYDLFLSQEPEEEVSRRFPLSVVIHSYNHANHADRRDLWL